MRLWVLGLLAGFIAPQTNAQHSIEASPNPYDSAVHDALVLRNVGTEPVALDSVAVLFRDAPIELAWWFGYTAYFGVERLQGGLECTHPSIHGSGVCVDYDGLYGRSLAPGDSVVLDRIVSGCGICRGTNHAFSRTDDDYFVRDTLLIYAGGAPEPLAVPLRQAATSSTEEGPAAVKLSIEVYPNPGSEVLNLRIQTLEQGSFGIRIFDVRGRLQGVPIELVTIAGESSIPIMVDHLTSGWYIIELYHKDANFTTYSKSTSISIIR